MPGLQEIVSQNAAIWKVVVHEFDSSKEGSFRLISKKWLHYVQKPSWKDQVTRIVIMLDQAIDTIEDQWLQA